MIAWFSDVIESWSEKLEDSENRKKASREQALNAVDRQDSDLRDKHGREFYMTLVDINVWLKHAEKYDEGTAVPISFYPVVHIDTFLDCKSSIQRSFLAEQRKNPETRSKILKDTVNYLLIVSHDDLIEQGAVSADVDVRERMLFERERLALPQPLNKQRLATSVFCVEREQSSGAFLLPKLADVSKQLATARKINERARGNGETQI